MNKQIEKCISDLKIFFPKSYIYKNDELIVEPKNNIYFRIDNIETALDFECKLLEWLSRPAHKGLNNYWHYQIKQGLKGYLRRDLTDEQIQLIYRKLGNALNRQKTIDFILFGYDFEWLEAA